MAFKIGNLLERIGLSTDASIGLALSGGGKKERKKERKEREKNRKRN